MARAIDADELIIKVNEDICRTDCVISTMFDRRFKKLVEEAPTIDTVKHGKWVKDRERDMLRCSACEDFYVDKWLYWYNHCPNCGARMDGE